ncbi:odorant receptor 46a-like [Maniola jurtina]|uniref:odorant receptor 46a-like n=1 Tax=Maniola jurtina TaxID=191418 RepID=UPI001E687BA0|nr:odorant receptor 46a-like [Maniola jurtina]
MALARTIRSQLLESDLFDFNIKYLTYVGLWPKDDWSQDKLRLYKVYEVFLFILSLTFIIITGIGTYEQKHNITMLMTNLDKALVSYNFVAKIMLFTLKKKQLNILISEIKLSGDKIVDERKNLMAIHVVIITIFSTLVVFAFSLLSQYKGEMTVEAWMPFDPMKSRMNLLLAAQLLAFCFVVPVLYRAFAIQGIVCGIIMYFCDQLIEVQQRLKGLDYSEERDGEIREELKNIVKKHVRIMRFSRTLTNIFKEYFLIQNLAVTIELCLNALMVAVVGLEEKTLLATFLGYLGLALINAYIYCYLGNELIVQSTGIAQAAYESGWTSWPIDMQKDLLIVINVAQKPLTLSAGGMALMCIETYSQALYNAYSIFAVLNDMVD